MSATWTVSFSDGKRISMRELFNGDGANPWDKALLYSKSNNIDITHLQIVVNGRIYNSPSCRPNSRFKSSEIGLFWVFYKQSADIDSNNSPENYIAYSYRAGDYRTFLWVNTENNHSYSQVLDVVNPVTKEEKDFSNIEKDIELAYGR